MGTLDGKVIAVTGASRGLGAAMAVGFAQEGAHLALAARTAPDLERVGRRCRDLGAASVEIVPTDVTDEAQVDALVAATVERAGRLDVFVANAGVAVPGLSSRRMTTLDTYERDVVDRLIAVNTIGMWLSMKAALPVMSAGGSFVAIGSEVGRIAGAGAGLYAVTKASVDLLVRIAAAEVSERQVRVNCLSPGGMVDTNLFGPDKMPAYIKERAPWSEPDVIVPAAVWLASDASAGITGKRLSGKDFNRTPLSAISEIIADV